jgi:hypothetical protein
MQMRSSLALAVVLLWTVSSVSAQDNVSWWRQMFGEGKAAKEAAVVPTADVPELPDSTVQEGPVLELEGPIKEPLEITLVDLPWGDVEWDIPEEIAALDSVHTPSDDIRIPGFRVQLFMGRLDSARSLRQYIANELDLDFEVHLTPYPPIFGVQVGDFRTPLEAHRAKRGLKPRFPNALVVPAELTVESAFPVAGDCIRTP